MSFRTRYSIIKGVLPAHAKEIVAEAARVLPGPRPQQSRWSDYRPVVKANRLVALACDDALILADDAWRLAAEISRLADKPHLELRIQESDHWDFTLYHHGRVIADFSTRVAYFDADPLTPRPWKQGDEKAFADCWGIAPECVRPYLIDWGATPKLGLACESDRYPSGAWEQIFDFMRAIGVDNPVDHPASFEFEVPKWNTCFQRQPWWRRLVRALSVRIRGVYPDVPRSVERRPFLNVTVVRGRL